MRRPLYCPCAITIAFLSVPFPLLLSTLHDALQRNEWSRCNSQPRSTSFGICDLLAVNLTSCQRCRSDGRGWHGGRRCEFIASTSRVEQSRHKHQLPVARRDSVLRVLYAHAPTYNVQRAFIARSSTNPEGTSYPSYPHLLALHIPGVAKQE
ncbi:hypothetical protein KC345_g60 [Hortaea werneckii]|nr:hypothetical protein KC345_g60 [Hortaea werneckii]